MEWFAAALQYLGFGVITYGLCWVYGRLISSVSMMQAIDEVPLRTLGVLTIIVFWPYFLVNRTWSLPFEIWMVINEGRPKR